jgi:hypothetical protein
LVFVMLRKRPRSPEKRIRDTEMNLVLVKKVKSAVRYGKPKAVVMR